MKYRIVELNNGKFRICSKPYFFSEWIDANCVWDTLEQCEQLINRRIKEKIDAKKEDEGRKTKRTVKVFKI